MSVCNSIAALGLTILLGVTSASAESDYYEHNGSRMLVESDGTSVVIVYDTPRSGLEREGVVAGTVLFEGNFSDKNYIDGMSRVFRKGCGVIDYYVYGSFTPGRDFTLNGAAPVLNGCTIVDNTYEGANANLVFAYQGDARPRPSGDIGKSGIYCITGVNSTLNMRSGPGTDYAVLGEISAHQCGIELASQGPRGWVGVRTYTGQLGWVASRYLTPQ